MRKYQVIIIGAGAAGLMAAKVLKSKGIEFLILESTDHVGGRAQTLKGNPHIEFGPEYLHGETPLTDSLMEEYHLPFYDLAFNYHLFLDGKLKPMPDFWERLCDVLAHIKAPRKDLSFLEYLAKYDHHSRNSQELAKMFVEGFDAADLDQVSTRALKEMKEQVCDPKARKLRRPLHGYGDLMDRLSSEVLEHIHFNHVVEDIKWQPGEVRVTGFKNCEEKFEFEYEAQKVLDTVSVAVLKRQGFIPKPTALTHFLEQVEMGQVMKLVGELEAEFFHLFDDHAFPFISSPELSFSAWWAPTPIHFPTVTAWAGGEHARRLALKSEEERSDIYFRELAKITSQPKKKIVDWVKEIHHHNWSEDPSFLGAYSYPRVHQGKDARKITAFEKTLYFAGEAFHSEMSGTIEGALVTGRDAALKMAS